MQSTLMRRLRSLSLGYGLLAIAILTLVTIAVFGNRSALLSLVASSASSLNGHQAVVFFVPLESESLTVGATTDIDIRLNAQTPINAVGATISFSPEMIEIVGMSKEKSFLNLWTEETSIMESAGEIRFSGGTLEKGGKTGIATLLTLTVRARKAGRAEFSIKEAEIFAHDGKGEEVDSDTRTFAYIVSEAPPRAIVSTSKTVITVVDDSPPSSDFNNDGRTSLSDISIFAIQLMASYNARFDLDRDGSVNLRDLSIVFSNARN